MIRTVQWYEDLGGNNVYIYIANEVDLQEKTDTVMSEK